jgi:hypothetical protein
MHSPEAFFDTLAIIESVQAALNGISRLEIQRCGYLACLLALYEGRPLADWGHRFARTEFGTPYSAAINDALDNLVESRSLSMANQRFSLTPSGGEKLIVLSPLRNLAERKRFLDAACGTVLSVPAATFSESLDKEPTMRRALLRAKGGGLLDGAALELLYKQFELLNAALDNRSHDLLVPSILWLTYMSNQPVSHRTGLTQL